MDRGLDGGGRHPAVARSWCGPAVDESGRVDFISEAVFNAAVAAGLTGQAQASCHNVHPVRDESERCQYHIDLTPECC